MGTVTTNTSTSSGDIFIIMLRAPTTVMMLVSICTRSFEREVFTVSIS